MNLEVNYLKGPVHEQGLCQGISGLYTSDIWSRPVDKENKVLSALGDIFCQPPEKRQISIWECANVRALRNLMRIQDKLLQCKRSDSSV